MSPYVNLPKLPQPKHGVRPPRQAPVWARDPLSVEDERELRALIRALKRRPPDGTIGDVQALLWRGLLEARLRWWKRMGRPRPDAAQP